MSKQKSKDVWLARDRDGCFVVGPGGMAMTDGGDWEADEGDHAFFCSGAFRRYVASYPRNMCPGAKPRRVEIIIREVEKL